MERESRSHLAKAALVTAWRLAWASASWQRASWRRSRRAAARSRLASRAAAYSGGSRKGRWVSCVAKGVVVTSKSAGGSARDSVAKRAKSQPRWTAAARRSGTRHKFAGSSPSCEERRRRLWRVCCSRLDSPAESRAERTSSSSSPLSLERPVPRCCGGDSETAPPPKSSLERMLRGLSTVWRRLGGSSSSRVVVSGSKPASRRCARQPS
mmetsp:Transcript_17166/g.52151  ORF Transcript_17166/g.52151 Transcript_17166/m.52151 type:complete len:210 (-) Transcript_17166:479-1108(-)